MTGFEPLHFSAYQREQVLSQFGVDIGRERPWRNMPGWFWAIFALGMFLETLPGSPIENVGWFPNLLWGVSLILLVSTPLLFLAYAYMRANDPKYYTRIVFSFTLRSIDRQANILLCVFIVTTAILSAATGGIWLSVCFILAMALNRIFLRYEMNEARRLLKEIQDSR